jgi:hypothetical protein
MSFGPRVALIEALNALDDRIEDLETLTYRWHFFFGTSRQGTGLCSRFVCSATGPCSLPGLAFDGGREGRGALLVDEIDNRLHGATFENRVEGRGERSRHNERAGLCNHPQLSAWWRPLERLTKVPTRCAVPARTTQRRWRSARSDLRPRQAVHGPRVGAWFPLVVRVLEVTQPSVPAPPVFDVPSLLFVGGTDEFPLTRSYSTGSPMTCLS